MATSTQTATTPASDARPTQLRGTTVSNLFRGVLGVLGFILVWESARLVGLLPRVSAPSMLTIFAELGAALVDGPLAGAMLRSLQTWLAGMAATLMIAIPIGLAVGLSRWLDAFLTMIFDFLRPVPAVAFVPLAVVFFGLGTQMEVFLVVIASVWPIIYNVRFGVQSLDPLLLDTGRTLKLNRFRLLWSVRLPAMIPSLFTGIRISASIAVVLVIVAELVASARGIGHYIEGMRQTGNYPQAWAGVIAAGLFGYVIAMLASALERRAASWHHRSKAASA